MPPIAMPSYHLITFGCQMNVNDSAWLSRALEAHGLTENTFDAAQVLCINTCSVREKAEQKLAASIARIRSLRQYNPPLLVCVLGCVAQQLGTKIFDLSPQVRLIVGPDGLSQLPTKICELLENPNEKFSFLDFTKY